MICARCGPPDKPAEEFAILETRTRHGRHSVCRSCEAALCAEADANPGKRYMIDQAGEIGRHIPGPPLRFPLHLS